MLKNTSYEVHTDGTLVKLRMGNVPVSMDYNTALQLAQFLRISGRKAKANAGDKSMIVRGYGVLSDAEHDERQRQSLTDCAAAFLKTNSND